MSLAVLDWVSVCMYVVYTYVFHITIIYYIYVPAYTCTIFYADKFIDCFRMDK